MSSKFLAGLAVSVGLATVSVACAYYGMTTTNPDHAFTGGAFFGLTTVCAGLAVLFFFGGRK